ncbi:receptor-like protein 7 [Syzygium oleosum]|uniref:receptor-like protein 7 n=1 Tax=Syzygium oleosum TaxID=219896 RepID=UPI0024BBDD8F|nr:receptor-like protein 7 [Syzygium oleosum]
MNGSLISWLVLAISTISIFSDVAGASASARCPGVGQRSLLLELRNSLVFDTSRSSKLVQWDQSADSWSGVTCEDGLIVGLDLSFESISGGIDVSSGLFRLEFLHSLNLAGNDFNSTAIPSGLGNLGHLENLDLSHARFAGQIPAELSRLTKLRTLDLGGDNLLKLEKPNFRSLIGDLGELRELNLDWVNVSAEGSDWSDAVSSSVPKLEVLSMSGCSLSGPIDASLTSLANLSVIQLDGNNLITTVPSFLANFSSLKTLSLGSCGLYGEFPQKIFQVQTLQTLDLSSNQRLQGSLPDFPEDSSLETMYLRQTNISGRLPDSIGNLRKLWSLKLPDCNLSGSIPSSMENLSELTYLDLSSNSLEGDIPPVLFTLPRLTTIDLSHNRFSGQLIIYPNVSSYQLRMLDLGSNQLQGSIPTSLFELQGLDYLSLSSNNFNGSMNIAALQGLGNLTSLNLSYSGLSINTTTSASASSFPEFSWLMLASCQLRTLPQFLANQSNFIFLDLSQNIIQGEIPRWIWTLEHLSYLNLSSNCFEDLETAPRNLTSALSVVDLHSNMLRGNMPPLLSQAGYLDFSSNKITSVIPDNIGDYLSSLMFFSLSKNNFHGSISKSICKCDQLEVLDLSGNNLNGTIPDCLMMASLKVLNLRNNQLSGTIPQNISRTCDLQTLDFSENLLQGQIPLSLANCTMLEVVNIGDNKINGTFPCHFKALSSLHVLVLRSNKLHGEIGCPHGPNTWQKLQIVDLSSNDFGSMLSASLLASWEAMKANVEFNYLHPYANRSGFYYEDTLIVTFKGLELELVKILTIFTSIDFSGNRLEGPIPDTLGDLKALHFLNLSHNAISGSIPPVLGNLHQLESLDLSWNYLNRTIPTQLANLHFLSFLNLSNNQLVGSIPASGQFLTFSESSFAKNLGLCGLQLNKSCSITTNGTEEAGDDGDDGDSEKKWFYLGIPLGFVVGFWIFCGPLVFIQSWRVAYYRFWDKVLFKHSRP